MGRTRRSSSSSSSSSQGPATTPTTPAVTQPHGNQAAAQQLTTSNTPGVVQQPTDLDAILRDYQVREDTMTEYSPALVGWLTDPVRMTETEAGLLGDLQFRQGLLGLYQFKDIKEQAYEVSGQRFEANRDAGLPGAEDGHQDAFRHIYWNVLMTQQFGPEFAAAFGSAHEGVPGNPADREAMDLFNNELGRNIALQNPDATAEELQDLVMDAITSGQAVVIDGSGELAFSDSVAVGATGQADDAPVGGGQAPPEWSGSL